MRRAGSEDQKFMAVKLQAMLYSLAPENLIFQTFFTNRSNMTPIEETRSYTAYYEYVISWNRHERWEKGREEVLAGMYSFISSHTVGCTCTDTCLTEEYTDEHTQTVT